MSLMSQTHTSDVITEAVDRLTHSSEDDARHILDSSSSGCQSLRRCKTSLDLGMNELGPAEEDGGAPSPRLTARALRRHEKACGPRPLDVARALRGQRDLSGRRQPPLPRVPEGACVSFFWFLDRR